MPAGNYTVDRVKNETLDGSFVDTVTIQGAYPLVEVVNRDTDDPIFVTVGRGEVPADPTVVGDNCEPVMPGERVVVSSTQLPTEQVIVKIIGGGSGGQAYSVIGTSR